MKKKKKKNSAGKVIGLIFGGLVIAVAVFALSCFLIAQYFIDKRNYKELNPDNFTILAETPSFIEDVLNPNTEPPSPDTDKEELESIKNAVESNAAEMYDNEDDSSIMNILLVGSDIREDEDAGRSDTMILVSINKENKQIVATSFLRDTFVKIPVKNIFGKLNASYAYGGMELLEKTLQYNYGITVDNYVMVNFLSFIEAIDILGGMDITVYEDELYWFNQYIHASNLLVEPEEREHVDYIDENVFDEKGEAYLHLNGKQALAYARFRYVGNGDFTRSDRQRRVVQCIFDKLKTMDIATLSNLLNQVMPAITTDLTDEECWNLILMLPELAKYNIVSWHIPDEDFQYISIDGDSYIGIDFSYYMKKLYTYIYTYFEQEETTHYVSPTTEPQTESSMESGTSEVNQ